MDDTNGINIGADEPVEHETVLHLLKSDDWQRRLEEARLSRSRILADRAPLKPTVRPPLVLDSRPSILEDDILSGKVVPMTPPAAAARPGFALAGFPPRAPGAPKPAMRGPLGNSGLGNPPPGPVAPSRAALTIPALSEAPAAGPAPAPVQAQVPAPPQVSAAPGGLGLRIVGGFAIGLVAGVAATSIIWMTRPAAPPAPAPAATAALVGPSAPASPPAPAAQPAATVSGPTAPSLAAAQPAAPIALAPGLPGQTAEPVSLAIAAPQPAHRIVAQPLVQPGAGSASADGRPAQAEAPAGAPDTKSTMIASITQLASSAATSGGAPRMLRMAPIPVVWSAPPVLAPVQGIRDAAPTGAQGAPVRPAAGLAPEEIGLASVGPGTAAAMPANLARPSGGAAAALGGAAPLDTAPRAMDLPPAPRLAPATSPSPAPLPGQGDEALAPTGVIVKVMTPTDSEKGMVLAVSEQAQSAGFAVNEPVEVPFKVSATHVRYYHATDREAADRLAARVGGEARDFTGSDNQTPEGTIELWMQGSAPKAAKAAKPKQALKARPAEVRKVVPAAPKEDPQIKALRDRLLKKVQRVTKS